MRLAAAAKKHGLYNGKYVFISLDLHTWDLKGLSTPSWYKKDLVEGWFDISPRSLSAVGTNTANDLKKIFLADLQMKLLQAPFWVQMKRVSTLYQLGKSQNDLDRIHTISALFENGENVADRTPVYTKAAHFLPADLKAVDFENGALISTF